MASESSPTARALVALELIQASPGITADRLAQRLDVSGRAARRYVGILREAGIAIQSTPGRYGGYRTGRGVRLPPMMFSPTEALGLVMAVLEGHGAPDPVHPVGSAIAKLSRALPAPVAASVEAVRQVNARRSYADATPDPLITASLMRACTGQQRLRLGYRPRPDRDVDFEVDPWDVIIRHGYWYLLCWSLSAGERRVLRVDRVTSVDVLGSGDGPPEDLDAMRELEEHLSQGWTYGTDVVIDAPESVAARWLRRSIGRLEVLDDEHCRLIGSTNEPAWYAEQLAVIPVPFRIVGSPELQAAAAALGTRLVDASGADADGVIAGGVDAGGVDAVAVVARGADAAGVEVGGADAG